MNDYDFDCLSGTKILEIGDDPGSSSNWLNYSTLLNTNLINTTCNLSGFVNSILGNEADDIAVHPENTSSCIVTSISKDYNTTEPIFFPNPTNGIIHISCDKNIKKIEIINEIGQIIYYAIDIKNINISKEPNGIYFLQITTENKIFSSKIIKL